MNDFFLVTPTQQNNGFDKMLEKYEICLSSFEILYLNSVWLQVITAKPHMPLSLLKLGCPMSSWTVYRRNPVGWSTKSGGPRNPARS